MKSDHVPSLVVAALLLVGGTLTIGQQRNPEEYAKFLEGAERVRRMQVSRVVQTLALKPGMMVADIGAGSGLFTRPIARAVQPDGIAYAVDIDEALLKIIERSAAEQRIANIRTVRAAPDDPRLPEPVDLIFLCDALHHIGRQAAYVKRLRNSIKPGGRIAVIDFSENWPAGHESMVFTLAELDGWMRGAGLSRKASYEWLENSFFAVYQ